jgi:hypothetical protein
MLSGGIFTGFERLGTKTDIENVGLVRQISLHIPASTICTHAGCGWDEFTQSGINPACVFCDGTGLLTTWHTAYARCRLSWIDAARVNIYKGIMPGEAGDVQVQGFLYDLELYRRVKDTDGAYILADEQRIKPYAVTQNQVEGKTTVDVRCNLVKD